MGLLLEADSLEKQYETVKAVNKLSFRITEGEIFSLLGPNGSGKTTTVRMVAGIIKPDNGSIKFNTKHLNNFGAIKIGYLPEDRGLYKDIPIIKTLEYMGLIQGLDRRTAHFYAMDWLKEFNLADRAADKFDTLSKGNQQKVQFISAVIHKPSFAILDEPFSGLDPINQELFIETILKLKNNGTTFLLSSHQMNLVERISDQVMLLNKGRDILSGKVNEVKNNWRVNNIIKIKLKPGCSGDYFEQHGLIYDFTQVDDCTVTFSLNKDASLTELLRNVPYEIEIESIHSEEVSLHEIYIQKVNDDTQTNGGENE